MAVVIKQLKDVAAATSFAYQATKNCLKGYSAKSKIIIKPNITFPKPPCTGVTTHHEIVIGVLEALKGYDNVYIVESDATSSDFEENIEGWGHEFLRDYQEFPLVNLSKSPAHTEALLGIDGCYDVEIPNLLWEYDLLINLPVLKTHILTGVSLGMKNLFGLLPVKQKSHYHIDIHDFIYAINRRFQSHLTIVDGIEGIEGPGPLFGDPAGAKVILAGDNVVEVDVISARIMGFEPDCIKYLYTAVLDQIDSDFVQGIRVIGDFTQYEFARKPVLPLQLVRALLSPTENTMGAILAQIDAPAQTVSNMPIFIQTLIGRGIICHEGDEYHLNMDNLDKLVALFPDTYSEICGLIIENKITRGDMRESISLAKSDKAL